MKLVVLQACFLFLQCTWASSAVQYGRFHRNVRFVYKIEQAFKNLITDQIKAEGNPASYAIRLGRIIAESRLLVAGYELVLRLYATESCYNTADRCICKMLPAIPAARNLGRDELAEIFLDLVEAAKVSGEFLIEAANLVYTNGLYALEYITIIPTSFSDTPIETYSTAPLGWNPKDCWVYTSTLIGGPFGILHSGHWLQSPYKHFSLFVTRDCNLVLSYSNSAVGVIWETQTNIGDRGCYLIVELNGNMKLVNSAQKTVWSLKNSCEGNGCIEDAALTLQDSGSLAFFTINKHTKLVWATDTTSKM